VPDSASSAAEPQSPLSRLVICSKSTWVPAIRREHALALEAARDGADVVFLERPLDVRSLTRSETRRRWLRAAVDGRSERSPTPGVRVRSRPTVVPAHRSNAALLLDTLLLERALRKLGDLPDTTIVATLPWQWPAVARVPAARRVLDYTDDWEALVPGREQVTRRLLDRAERDADAITVVSGDLQQVFTRRTATVVRNGVGADVLGPPAQPLPRVRRLVYVGTLSDRFDAPLVADTLDRLLGEWSLELYGPCQYPGSGDQPSDELRSLLRNPRVSWHGPIERRHVAAALDRGDVLLAPHRRTKPGSAFSHPSWRGDAMKFYDYAARARVIVSTNWALQLADDAAGLARAVEEAARTPDAELVSQREWAAEHAWSQRWTAWKDATGFKVQCVATERLRPSR
jgi:hypothetical protein